MMRTLVIPLLILLGGCRLPTRDESELEIHTTGSAFAPGQAIAVRVVNPTRDIIGVAHCDQRVALLVERRAEAVWSLYRQTNVHLCQPGRPHGEIFIAPGTEHADTVRIQDAGEYRLALYGRRRHEDFGSMYVISRRFTVGTQ
jgi:hypothetical protein